MIEEKVELGDDISLNKNLNPENSKYKVDGLIEGDNYNRENKFHYKIHIREIFYKFRGKHLFPDRG